MRIAKSHPPKAHSPAKHPPQSLQKKIGGLEARLSRLHDKFERADSPRARERLQNRIEHREQRLDRLEKMQQARRAQGQGVEEPGSVTSEDVESPFDFSIDAFDPTSFVSGILGG